MKKILILLYFLLCMSPVYAEGVELGRARVLEVSKEEKSLILQEIGQGVEEIHQTIQAEILDGTEKGKQVTLDSDSLKLDKGDVFFIQKTSTPDEDDQYVAVEKDRQFPILVLIVLFVFTILIFGGKQGLRSLLSLVGGFLVIIYLLLPLLAKGYPPVLVSVGFATVILFIAIYFTHGFNRESTVAFSGTIISVVLTSILAFFSVYIMKLTGFNTEEAMFLNLGNSVRLNFHGLLLGGILIGVLGILDDIAVTQSAVVSEMYNSAPTLTHMEVYKKAMRVGREHVSALVNTLVLAYAGASLPLLLLFSNYDYPFRFIISEELFATEIVRTIVGSIGLVITVPITTLLAVYLLKGHKGKSALGHHHH